MPVDPDVLRGELSRVIAHRVALQEALAASEVDRFALRVEVKRLRGVNAQLRAAAPTPTLPGAAAAPRRSEAAAERPPASPRAPLRIVPKAPVIEVRDLSKRYRLPAERIETLKERVLHPMQSRRGTELQALDEVSFDVHRGEFFGIAGANGSGKSTLLKLLANVYAADSGSIRSAGRIAPFIELGVGLNPEFSAYDNVVISGVMMGLEPEQARARFHEVIEFAGLEEFTELKLKNYSSGMRVRLAFAVMAQVDADILLVDEVLAVGDADFRAKCLARMNRLREEGKTIVFVTHAMDALVKECDRAILLAGGRIRCEGDPAEVARLHLAEQERARTVGVEDEPPVKAVGA